MKTILRVTMLLSALTMGNIASAQDVSFSQLQTMSSFEKDMLTMAIEQGQFTPDHSSPSRNIDLNGISSGNQDDITLFLRMLILDVCPECATTSSGSTVRVTYGNSAGSGKDAYVQNSNDNYTAREIEEKCDKLLDDRQYERSGKDILIVANNDDDDKIALCFDRD